MEHLYLNFNKASVILRNHRRDITPPGMVEIVNAIPPRSDSAITIRPDFTYAQDNVYGMSGDMTLPGTSQIRDAVNTISGLFGSTQIVYFTPFIPYGINDGYSQILSASHGSGKASTEEDSSVIRGVGCGFQKKAYRGSIVRFESAGVPYTGGTSKWTESPADSDEYYLTKLDDNAVPILGSFIKSINGRYFIYNEPGNLSSQNIGFGDNDTLGFNTLYARFKGDVVPGTLSGTGARLFDFDMCTGISGTPYKWTESSATSDEYYLTKKDGSVPDFVPGSAPGSSDTPEYIRNFRTQYRSYAKFPDSPGVPVNAQFSGMSSNDLIGYGQVGSLADHEWGVGDADTLGFDTVYLRSDGGDPDTVLGVSGDPTYLAYPFSGVYVYTALRWPQSVFLPCYKNISHGEGDYAWVKSNVYQEVSIPTPWGSNTYKYYAYYLTYDGGDPKIPRPDTLYIDGRRATPYRTPDDLDGGNRTYDFYTYGDAAVDGLGYDTIYVRPNYKGGSVTSADIDIITAASYIASNYSWVASANAGSNEYYLAQQDGTQLAAAFPEPYAVEIGDKREAAKGTIASLAEGEWDHGKDAADSLTHDTIYFRSDNGDPDTIGVLLNAVYKYTVYSSEHKWVVSATSNEWYLVTVAGGDPGVSSPTIITVDGTEYDEGTVGSLAYNEWDYGDNDSLGFSTVYIYSTVDPNGTIGDGLGADVAPINIQVRDASADFNYYLVDNVKSDDEMNIFGEAVSSISNAKPYFYYNHNPFRTDYKMNVQAYTSGIIYCTPAIDANVNEEDISGPFYAGLQKGDWKYDHKNFVDQSVTGTGVPFENQGTTATNGSSYIQIYPWMPADNLSLVDYMLKSFALFSYGIGGADSWDRYSFNPGDDPNKDGDFTQDGGAITSGFAFSSIKTSGSTYYASGQEWGYTPDKVSPAFAWSNDTFGIDWTIKRDEAYEWAGVTYAETDYMALSAAWSGESPGRIVCLYWRKSDDRVVCRYSDNSGATWNDTNIAGSGNTYFAGGTDPENRQVDYIDGQFVITLYTGCYYGDGATFTAKSIGSGITSIAFNGGNEWAAKAGGKVWTCDTLTGTWTSTTFPDSSNANRWITWDKIGERWVVNGQWSVYWSDNLLVDEERGGPLWAEAKLSYVDNSGQSQIPSRAIFDNAGGWWTSSDANPVSNIHLSRFSYYFWDVDLFEPISENYRSTTFSVLNGYVVLIGTREREFEKVPFDITQTITETPTADGTENDFTFKLSKTGDYGIEPESFTLTVELTNGTKEEITDDGAGTLKGNVSATGTISYETGDCRLVFNELTAANAANFFSRYKYLVEGETTGWKHYPRRIRWTAPKTYNDFSGVGSGTADANGDGIFLDARPVNGRIVVFETNGISSIVPRGDFTDPWDFDSVQEGVSIISNPVAVDDFCYFIATDGLLWQTNGIGAKEVGASYDATKFDDFTELSPISLVFSRKLNALLAYYFNANDETPSCHAISLANGMVTEIALPLISDNDTLSEKPRFVSSIEDSSDDRIIVSYHPLSTNTDAINLTSLSTGKSILGRDTPVSSTTDYWHSLIETGELFIQEEGVTTSVKHYIFRTYTSAGTGDNDYRPLVAVAERSLDDDEWYPVGDDNGIPTMSTTGVTGTWTAWSNKIAGPQADANTTQYCDGADKTFTVPCAARKCRVYLDSTLQVRDTDYTTSGKVITFATAPAADKTLYAYWDSSPEVKVKVGDVLQSANDMHIITAINSAQDIECDHYISSGTETVRHYTTVEMPDGEAETKLGTNRLVEGLRLRIYVIPQYNYSTNPSIVKISGLTIGHIPSGKKILQATGS